MSALAYIGSLLDCLVYLARHKYFVLRAGIALRAPLWRLLVHDWSKLLPSQFFPYARYYHAGAVDPAAREAYRRAWLRHVNLSPHHWEHWTLPRRWNWIDTVEALEMPEGLVREMVADWAGAGRAMHGRWDLKEWYLGPSGHCTMVLHPGTSRMAGYLVTGFRAGGGA